MQFKKLPPPPWIKGPPRAFANVRYAAERMDENNEIRLHDGRPPRHLRESYPDGWGPGQTLRGPIRAQLAAFVDAADPVEVEAANRADTVARLEAFLEKHGEENVTAALGADVVASMRADAAK